MWCPGKNWNISLAWCCESNRINWASTRTKKCLLTLFSGSRTIRKFRFPSGKKLTAKERKNWWLCSSPTQRSDTFCKDYFFFDCFLFSDAATIDIRNRESCYRPVVTFFRRVCAALRAISRQTPRTNNKFQFTLIKLCAGLLNVSFFPPPTMNADSLFISNCSRMPILTVSNF